MCLNILARVSTKNQKDDLQNQTAFLRQFCNARGMIVDQCIEEYGSGLNYNRKNKYKKQIEGDDGLAKELQDGNQSYTGADNEDQ